MALEHLDPWEVDGLSRLGKLREEWAYQVIRLAHHNLKRPWLAKTLVRLSRGTTEAAP
jgi:hypothetical protein